MKSKKIVIIGIILIFDIGLTILGIYANKSRQILDKNFHLNGKNNVSISFGTDYVDDGFDASIKGIDYKKDVIVDSNLNTEKVGKYKITYSLEYKTYTKTLQRTINVVDSQMPILKIDCDQDIYITVNEKFNGCSYKALDNYDGDISNKVKVTSNVNSKVKGDYKVTYKITDSNNNTATETINVHVTNKFEHTYVEVNISKQKLKYYQYKKVILETPVTTGKYNLTKPGDYKVNKKVRNTYLVGKNYKSFVKYWMAYSGSKYGLHDASWRDKFGTNNYYVNGSHGCVNIPTDAAGKLYSLIEVGTPVYIRK